MHISQTQYKNIRLGFTLLELLVVIGILSIATAMLVPRVRTLTKERGIRAAARTLAAALSEAAGEARVKGYAAVELVRNAKVYRLASNSGNRVYYACYSIRTLNAPPSFFGDNQGDTAVVTGLLPLSPPNPLSSVNSFSVTIPVPMDHQIVVRPGCTLKLGANPTQYLIKQVGPGPNLNTFSIIASREIYQSIPQVGVPHAFRIDFPSSESINAASTIFNETNTQKGNPLAGDPSLKVLPTGYFVNLNYSGPLSTRDSSGYTWTAFSEEVVGVSGQDLGEESIVIEFGPRGSVTQIWTNGFSDPRGPLPPSFSIQFCVCEDIPSNSFDFSGVQRMPRSYYDDPSTTTGVDVLSDPSVLWVTLNHQTGRVSIGENASVTGVLPKPESETLIESRQAGRLLEALGFARRGTNAIDQ